MQYYDTGGFGIFITFLMVGFILVNIWRAKATQGNLFIRRIAGLNAIDEAVGRATEMGRPVLMVPGLGQLNAIAVQAINVFEKVAETACKFSTPIRVCCADAAVYTVAQEQIRDVYQRAGMIEKYDVDYVQFVSDRQFAFAAGVSGMIRRDKTAATFFLGEFFAESLIFAEAAYAEGAIQVAGSTQTTQTPFFVAACDYVLIGDEYYAASAYLNREPILVGSLIGQDWIKILGAVFVALGCLIQSFQWNTRVTEEWKDGAMIPLKVDRKIKGNETAIGRFMNPREMPEGDQKKVVRTQRTPNWWESPSAEGEAK